MTAGRRAVLDGLADDIAAVKRPHPVRVAIDGVDAAGKTTLADELVALLESRGRPVIRASVDGFHRPRAERYRRGPDSPEGYYHDSFDYLALREALLDPLGPGGTLRYRRAVYDFHADSPVGTCLETATSDAILLFDGIFALRPELASCWDYSIFVHADFEVTLRRAIERNVLGSAEDAEKIRARYVPGQAHLFGGRKAPGRRRRRRPERRPGAPEVNPAPHLNSESLVVVAITVTGDEK